MFEISKDLSIEKGIVTMTWTDSADAGPYQVTYRYFDPSSSAIQVSFWAGGNEKASTTNLKQFVFDDLIPGKQYVVTITDSRGTRLQETITLPVSSFVDGKLKASSIDITIGYRYLKSGSDSPQKINELKSSDIVASMSNGNSYGLFYRVDIPQLSKDREFKTLFAFYAPNGFAISSDCGVVSYSSFGNASSSYCYWNQIGSFFFEKLYEKNGSIPTGEYRVELYWDGMLVNSKPFKVN